MAQQNNDRYKDAALYGKRYIDGAHPQPNTVMNEMPDERYFLDWHRYVYSLFCGGGCATYPDGLFESRTHTERKLYADGRQPVDKMKKLVDVAMKEGKIVDGSAATGTGSLLNISWDNFMAYPKYRTLAASKAAAIEYAATIRAIDSQSAYDRRKAYAKAKLSIDPRMQQLFATADVIPGESMDYVGMTKEDIDMSMQTGGFALPFEIMMEDVVGCTFDLSMWPEIAQQLILDQIDHNKMAWVVECVKTQKALRIKYVDPEGMIVPVSRYKDHRTDQFRAFIERTNIATLRAETGMSEKELWEIARGYSAFGPNASSRAMYGKAMNDLGWRNEYMETRRQQVYDHFAIDVMNLWFIACQVESSVVGTNPDGSTYSRAVAPDYSLSEEEAYTGAQKIDNHVQYVYKSKWVVGTDKVFCYGVDDTVVREGVDGSKTAMIPMLAWTSNESSITERCIAAIDDIQLAVLKIRLLIANLPPGPRMVLDMSILDDVVEMSSGTYDMKSLLKLFGATGKLLVRSRNEFAGPGQASNKSPISPVPVDVQSDFNLFSAQIVAGLDMIRQATGLNEITDGTGNPRDVLNKVAAGFQSASNNALSQITDAMSTVYKSTATLLVKKYQALSLWGEISVKNWPVDANTLSMITLPDNINMYNFDVVVEMLPTQEDIQIMTQQVFQKQMENKVTEADVFAVLQMLRSKDIKKAQVYLARAVARGEQAQSQQQLQMIQAQAQANAQSVQASEGSKQQTVDAQFQADFKLNEQQAAIDEKVRREEHQRALEILEKKAELDIGANVATKTFETGIAANSVS